MVDRGIRPKTSSELNLQASDVPAAMVKAGQKSSTTTATLEVRLFDCQKCEKTLSIEDVFQMSTCLHKFCRDCASAFLLDWHTLRCPLHPRCRAEMTLQDAVTIIDESELEFCSTYEGDLPSPQQVDDDNDSNSNYAPSSSSNIKATFQCAVCNETTPFDDIFNVSKSCQHQLCRNCAIQHVTSSWFRNRSSMATSVRCPIAGCLSEVDFDNIEMVLDFSEIRFAEEPQPTFDCQICLETLPVDDIFQSEGCKHQMCRRCARTYLCSLIDDQKALACPVSGCKAELTVFDAEMVLNAEEFKRLSKMLLSKAVIEFVHCPQKDCPGLAEVVPPCSIFICPACRYHMCVQCRKDWHPTVSCDDFANWLEENGAADERFGDYVRKKNIQACPVCRQGVEKTEGCNHMTCRCQTHFCYMCGKKFQSPKWEDHGKCVLFEYKDID